METVLVPRGSSEQTVKDVALCPTLGGRMGIYCPPQIITAYKVTSDLETRENKTPV